MTFIPKVIALVLTYNNISLTKKCVKSIIDSSYPSLSIYLVDNGSEFDCINPVVSEHRKLNYIALKKNVGYAGGFNEGIKFLFDNKLEFDYILLVTNDLELGASALDGLVGTMENDQNIGFLGPETFKRGGSGEHDQWITKLAHKDNPATFFFDDETEVKEENQIEVEFVVGHCMLIRKEMIIDVGLMRDFFIYWEEREWQWRAKKKGWKTYVVPGSLCYHDRDSMDKPYNTFWRIRNLIFFNRIVLADNKRFFKHFIRNIYAQINWAIHMTIKRQWDRRHLWNFVKGFMQGFIKRVPPFQRINKIT